MGLAEPRIQPLPESEWDADASELLNGLRRDGVVFNIFSTLVRHPQLFKKWLVFAGHILSGSTLPAREREIVILRVGWLCRARYEWGHHVAIGRQAGLNDQDLKRIAQGKNAPGLERFESLLIEAVDQLHLTSFVDDNVWTRLSERYSTQQLLDLIFTVGQYKLVSMVLNTTGVQLEPGFEGFSDETQG